MASTQDLTELPVIQYTGMDYSTVISQIKEIIENNSNWAENWTEFYNSEAGTMLIQLMAWICDNLAVRQDLLYNESFLSTATSEQAKRRLLKQIGYSMKSSSAAVIPVTLEFKNIVKTDVSLSLGITKEISPADVKTNIFRFYGPDRNGNNTFYEILHLDENYEPDYTEPVVLSSGSVLYDKDKNGNTLYACQGNTVYSEFSSDTNDGPVFVLENKNIDLKTIKVYDLKNENKIHDRVDNFMDLKVMNGDNTCDIIEQNEDGYYQIRYPNLDLVTYNNKTLANRLFKAGSRIGVLYRTCNGEISNVAANYFYINDIVNDDNGNSLKLTITNKLAGFNGKDGETLDNAVKNAPLSIRTMNRAVTINDYDIILNNNDMVLNSKSYSPENEPDNFIDFYGRRIAPHEVFSFVVLNKGFKSIPNNKLNYYPWIELNKNNIFNEKYMFGNSVFNSSLSNYETYNDLYIEYNYDNDKEYKVEGNTTKDTEKKIRHIPNAIVFKGNDLLKNTINREKQEDENSDVFKLKIKLQDFASEEVFIDEVLNALNTKKNITTADNGISEDTMASYTSDQLEEYIDCLKYKYIKFVIDDLLTIVVDLQKDNNYEDKIESIDMDISKYPLSNYYLKIKNNYNNDSDYFDYDDRSNLDAYCKKLRELYSSKEAAENRKSIEQLIRDELNRVIEYDVNKKEYDITYEPWLTLNNIKSYNTIPTSLKTWLSDDVAINDSYSYNNNSFTLKSKVILNEDIVEKIELISNGGSPENHYIYFKKEDDESYSLYEILENEEYNEKGNIPTENTYTQQLAYNSVLANGNSGFVDLNLQKEKNTEFVIEQDYTTDYKKTAYFYFIKINNKTYAVRLDAFSLLSAYNYYKLFNSSFTGSYEGCTAIYPYIGKGKFIINPSCETPISPISPVGTFSFDNIADSTLEGGLKGVYSYEKFDLDDIPFNENKNSTDAEKAMLVTDNGEIIKCRINLKILAYILDYAFSGVWQLNKGIIYEYDNGQFKDIESNDKIKGFRIRQIEKANYPSNNCVDSFNTNNIFTSGYEYDLRFDLLNYFTGGNEDNDFIIESYDNDDETELKQLLKNKFASDNEVDVAEVDVTTKDLLKTLKGDEYSILKYVINKKEYKIDGDDNNDNYILQANNDYNADDNSFNYATLKICSGNKGSNSSLYFIQTSKNSNEEFIQYAGLKNKFKYGYNKEETRKSTEDYKNEYRSIKVYGQKIIELFVGENDNVITASFNKYDGTPLKESGKINVGDIICVDSDINYVNFTNPIYISYKASDEEKLLLNKQENFYYSPVESSNNKAKPPIIGIAGESVFYDESNDCYYIDNLKSDFNVKLTKDEVDVNNYDSIIAEDDNLSIIRNKNVEICSAQIDNDDNNLELSFSFGIDDREMVKIEGCKITSASQVVNTMQNALKESSEYKDCYKKVVSLSYDNSKKIKFSGLAYDDTGCIKFGVSPGENESDVKDFFKTLFGTSISNKELYELYPNNDDPNDYDYNNCAVNDNENESYYYYPNNSSDSNDKEIEFKYRKLIGNEPRYGDYYIVAEPNGSLGFKTGYKFYIQKTKNAKFPDKEFYVHFVNDRKYEVERNTEEDTIINYMKEHQIVGTELHLLEPYFKTFDIKGTINYSGNYDVSLVKRNVENALKNKYSISNIKDIEIGKDIYRSDIFKTVMNIEGVESFELEYFGYDYTDGNDKKYSLQVDFYVCAVLASSENDHGLNLVYEKVNNGVL